MSEALVLRQDPTKLRWVLLGGLVLALLSAWIALDSDRFRGSPEFNQVFGALGFLFFGVGSVRAALRRPDMVTLAADGFAVQGRPPTPWSDVDHFFIVTIRRTKLVSYKLKPEAKAALRGMASVNAALSLTTADGQLPAFLDRPPEEVCGLLNAWRARFSNS